MDVLWRVLKEVAYVLFVVPLPAGPLTAVGVSFLSGALWFILAVEVPTWFSTLQITAFAGAGIFALRFAAFMLATELLPKYTL